MERHIILLFFFFIILILVPNDVQGNKVCFLKPKQGPCLAYFRRYYYNWKRAKCVKFIYGGCQGNGNNFHSIAECRRNCPFQKG
ncbi:mambaquaretin-4-like [Mytilus trossulus]|uniref:mambaquaretin-4-like n=1 Tax=Mytilus trossulus TaxID=6551 RepID=UPI003004CA0D